MAPVEKSTDKIIPNPSDALEFKPVKGARPRRTGLKFFMFFIESNKSDISFLFSQN